VSYVVVSTHAGSWSVRNLQSGRDVIVTPDRAKAESDAKRLNAYVRNRAIENKKGPEARASGPHG